MSKYYVFILMISLGFWLGHLPIEHVQAAIKCKDGYQIIKGQGQIGTPYCGDKWLSKISGVSFAKLRNDPTERRRVCLMYSGDVKVRSICGIDSVPYFPTR